MPQILFPSAPCSHPPAAVKRLHGQDSKHPPQGTKASLTLKKEARHLPGAMTQMLTVLFRQLPLWGCVPGGNNFQYFHH